MLPPTHADIVIIGSGFGGAVAAARLGAWARANKKTVLVIEKGRDHTGDFDRDTDDSEPLNDQGNRFKHTLDPRALANVAELHTDTVGAFKKGFPSMTVVTGKGLGGGSNVYDGVSLRAPKETFEQTRDNRRLWPTVFTRASLDPFYEKVSARLSVNRLAWATSSSSGVPHWQLTTMRDYVFAEGCSRIGATAVPLKVATKNDANEGWWNQGQRFEGRQSLSKNYLRDAKASGAVTFQTCSEVESLERSGATKWLIKGSRSVKGSAEDFEIEASVVVVAAGAVGSTGLLLRSRKNLDALGGGFDRGGLLGKRVSGNGDYGVTGVIGAKYAEQRAVRGERGKPMSSFCPSFWREHKFLLIPFHADPLYIALGQPTTFLRPADNAFVRGGSEVKAGERDWGIEFKQRLSKFSERALTMGCLALDHSEGEIRLNAQGRESVVWPTTHDRTERRWQEAVSTMRRIYESLDGEMFLDVYRQNGTVNTAHPLGGCPMTDTPSLGVVDPQGEVFGCPNLFIIDGAIIPSALGVNPSLTIAAVAESITDRLTRGEGTKALADRLT